MVDTINPNATSPIPDAGSSVSPVSGNFFNGFSKPDDVHLNLAAEETTAAQSAMPSPAEPSQPVDTNPPSGNLDGFRPTSTSSFAAPPENHQTYNTAREPLNIRGILFIAAVGLGVTIFLGATTYFVTGSIYSKKLAAAETDLVKARSEYSKVTVAPTPLELPVVAPVSNEPTAPVTPVETPAAEKIEAPAETPAVTQPNGGVAGQG